MLTRSRKSAGKMQMTSRKDRPKPQSAKSPLSHAIAVGLLAVGTAFLRQSAHSESRDPLLFHRKDGLTIRSHFQAGINFVAEENLFWNLSEVFAQSSGLDPDTEWFESYIKPGLSFEQRLASHQVLYGKISAVLSDTRGTDAYDTGDTGRGTLEEAHLGYRFEQPDGLLIDVSGGRIPLKLGTGMLVENGASSGFERGALKLGPRQAWERAGIARFGFSGVKSTTFYLDPNETEANDSRTELAGTDLRYDSKVGGYAGLTYLNVLKSEAPYPKAATGGVGIPSVMPNARGGLNALNVYARTDKFSGSLSGLFLTTDVAYEWNDHIDLRAWAARGQIGYTFARHRWRPTFMYTFQTFSGDDPNTQRLERFDPLFFEGSPSSWATGSKSSFNFINSNLHAHQLTLSISPTDQDKITLRYAHIRANELRSPIQFGQSTRFDVNTGQGLVASVIDSHLADDIFLEYSRIVSLNMFVTAGVSASIPGAGLEQTVRGTALGGELPVWLGGFVNIVVNY